MHQVDLKDLAYLDHLRSACYGSRFIFNFSFSEITKNAWYSWFFGLFAIVIAIAIEIVIEIAIVIEAYIFPS